jgi:uncharacterized protein with GYD domain
MTRTITLLTFTDQGAKNIKKSPARARQFSQLAEKSGVKVKSQFWTVGRFDGLLILEADKESQILALLAKLAALGNVKTETLVALTDREFESIMNGR